MNNAMKNLNYYAKKADFYVLPIRVNKGTLFLTLTGAELVEAAKSAPSFFSSRNDELEWKGLQATKSTMMRGLSSIKRDKRKDFILPIAKADFKRGADGTISLSMENAIADHLSRIYFLGQKWEAVGHNTSGRGYHPDLVSELGMTIEVKGWKGELKARHNLNMLDD